MKCLKVQINIITYNINNNKEKQPNNEVFEGSDNADLLVEGTNLTGTYNSSSCQCSAIKKHHNTKSDHSIHTI